MGKIKVLPDKLANQIAAGEVVERPASVVKELVENAIDAGARRISVDVELGGRRLIKVSDDGVGMSAEDAVLAFERHATSKIAALEDLVRISSLGFRGEALPSIASVARVEMVTKAGDGAAAVRVRIEGGRLADVGDAARPTGTTVAVRDLFFNTPARRKFMRAEATENFHISSAVTHYALAHPGISFGLTSNGREVLSVPPARDLRERAYQLFGPRTIESLVPVEHSRDGVCSVRGFVSAPRERRTSRDSQFFFVNGRFVRDKLVSKALSEGYRSVLPHGVYPVAFLFIGIPADEVDVNVHPAKTEVRFRRADAVRDEIAYGVRQALTLGGMAVERILPSPTDGAGTSAASAGDGRQALELASEAAQVEADAWNDFPEEPAPYVRELPGGNGPDGDTRAGAGWRDTASPAVEAVRPTADRVPEDVLQPFDSAAKIVRAAEPDSISTSKIKPIAQLHESFIIAVDDQGLLLIDQHVAHERILFDRFRRKEEARPVESQQLLLPETIELSPAQAVAFDTVEADLAELGFGLMRLSGRTVAVKALPADLPSLDARNLLAELLDSVDAGNRGSARASFRDEIAASLACKAAVKINMKLTPEKMQWLVDGLLRTSSPTTCPHGRPVVLRLTMKDIERGFHRT